MLRVASVVVLVAALQACTLGPDTELTLEVQSSDPAVVARAARVLSARFREFRPSLVSSSKFAIEGSTIRFTFRNGAPEPEIVEYLYSTRGHFRAALASDQFGEPWLTDGDVSEAHVTYQDSMPALAVRLTPEAGQRLTQLTTDNVGQVVRMTLDGETLMEARIQGVFGERFMITGQDSEEDIRRALTVVLTTGALPADVRAFARPRFEAPASRQ
jgi:hypothetical protein